MHHCSDRGAPVRLTTREQFEIGFMRDTHPERGGAKWSKVVAAWASYHEKYLGGLIRPEAEEQKIVDALAMTLEVDAPPIAAVFDAALATGDFHQNSPHRLRGGVVRWRPVWFLAGDRLTKESLVASSYQWIAICHS